MKKTIYTLIALALLSNMKLQAQELISITKTEVLGRVSENNTSIKISEEEFKQARADYRQTNAVFLPNITASHTALPLQIR